MKGNRGGSHHVCICVCDDVSREIPGLHLLAEGSEPHCCVDCSNWQELTDNRKTLKHRHCLK